MSNEITARPILFSGAMIRAILENRKTQTRRAVKGGKCPYGNIGDVLWVRETFAIPDCACYDNCRCPSFIYKANLSTATVKWKPSIFMPRDAARIMLEITNRRIERLQDISEADAQAEGVNSAEEFKRLWTEINGADSWERNEMVWVIDFKPYFRGEK